MLNKERPQPGQSVFRSIFEKGLPNNRSEASPFEATLSSSLDLMEDTESLILNTHMYKIRFQIKFKFQLRQQHQEHDKYPS